MFEGATTLPEATIREDVGSLTYLRFMLGTIADIDGDRAPDIVTRNEVRWNAGEALSADRLVVSAEHVIAGAGDLDGDGDLDLLLHDEELRRAGPFFWSPYLGGRRFGALRAFGVEMTSALVSDLDGDGIADVVFTNEQGTSWLPGRGDGEFADPQVVLDGARGRLYVGSWDRDVGPVPLIHPWYSGVILVSSPADPARRSARVVTTAGEAMDSGLADIDGDGRTDIVAAHGAGVGWYRSLPTGGVSAFRVVSPRGWFHPSDADGDGDVDLRVDDRWLVNDGAGDFLRMERDGLLGAEERPFFSADIDLDGDLDLFTDAIAWDEGQMREGLAYNWLGRCVRECGPGMHDGGSGECTDAGECSPGYQIRRDGLCLPAALCAPGLGDDGTGRCVALGSCGLGFWWDGARCRLQQRCPPGLAAAGDGRCLPRGECAPGYAPLEPYHAVSRMRHHKHSVEWAYGGIVADFDGDGALDLLHLAEGRWLRWRVGDPAGRFGPARAVGDPEQTFDPPVSAADIDGDGDPDVAAFTDDGLVWFENVDGSFAAPTLFAELQRSRLLWGDLDEDGLVDALAGAWARNPGADALPASIESLPPLPDDARYCGGTRPHYFDVDGDGDLDRVFGVGVWLNQGGGVFEEPRVLPGCAWTAGDFNGDGYVDFLDDVGVDRFRRSELFLSRGPDAFEPPLGLRYPPEQYAPFDMDFDGDLDLVSMRGSWLPNLGDGRFGVGKLMRSPWTRWGPGPFFSGLDFDGDGLQDLYESLGRDVRIYFTQNGRCVPIRCNPGEHDGGDGRCLAVGMCAGGFHDGGRGGCVPEGTCHLDHHDGGVGTCVPLGQCSAGFQLGATGQCDPEP